MALKIFNRTKNAMITHSHDQNELESIKKYFRLFTFLDFTSNSTLDIHFSFETAFLTIDHFT